MSAPYYVSYGYGDGYRECATLDDAIEFALARAGDISVRIYADGADIDSDGLTDEERERVEEAGL